MATEVPGERDPEERLWAENSGVGNAEIESPLQERRTGLRDYLGSYEVIELFFCAILVIPTIISEFGPVDPRQRSIPTQLLESGEYVVNQTYDESFDGETFPDTSLMLLGVVLPIVIQVILSKSRGAMELHKTACVYFAGVCLTMLLTNAVKLYAGYLRPIFLEVCQPDDAYETCTSGDDNGARKSWPSGHSSISFCGLGLLSFYLERRFGEYSLRTWTYDTSTKRMVCEYSQPVRFRRLFSILCYTPMLLAGWIASSRVVDNKHFPADVVSGVLLGGSIAYWIFGIWFPAFPTGLGSENSFTPRYSSTAN